MEFQSELWVILQDDEYDYVWKRVYSEFCFSPSVKPEIVPFQFQVPFDCYDINYSYLYENDDPIDEIIKSVFIECMENDDFMYALDWHHTCFKYNPRINIEPPTFIADERYTNGGYNVYFPPFYPDGDYYFFIAKDFRGGYLTHPWLEKVWVFGDKLMPLIKQYSEKIGLVPYM